MALTIISTIKPANDLSFPVVEANDVKGGLHQVKTLTDLSNLPVEKRMAGMMCFVESDNNYYKYINDNWELFSLDGTIVDMTIEEAKAMMTEIFNI